MFDFRFFFLFNLIKFKCWNNKLIVVYAYRIKLFIVWFKNKKINFFFNKINCPYLIKFPYFLKKNDQKQNILYYNNHIYNKFAKKLKYNNTTLNNYLINIDINSNMIITQRTNVYVKKIIKDELNCNKFKSQILNVHYQFINKKKLNVYNNTIKSTFNYFTDWFNTNKNFLPQQLNKFFDLKIKIQKHRCEMFFKFKIQTRKVRSLFYLFFNKSKKQIKFTHFILTLWHYITKERFFFFFFSIQNCLISCNFIYDNTFFNFLIKKKLILINNKNASHKFIQLYVNDLVFIKNYYLWIKIFFFYTILLKKKKYLILKFILLKKQYNLKNKLFFFNKNNFNFFLFYIKNFEIDYITGSIILLFYKLNDNTKLQLLIHNSNNYILKLLNWKYIN